MRIAETSSPDIRNPCVDHLHTAIASVREQPSRPELIHLFSYWTDYENTDMGVWKPRKALMDAAILPNVRMVGLPRTDKAR